MRKDIFIDNNVAGKFSNPQDKEYLRLTKWLLYFDINDEANKDNYAHLVVSKKLLVEYYRSSMGANSSTAIPVIISKLQKEGRLILLSKQQLQQFKRTYFSKTIERKFRSNREDRELIPVVLLSDRKYAITYDVNFTYDLENFPGFSVFVRKRPEDIPYDQ